MIEVPTWEGILIHHAAAPDGLGLDLELYRDWHMRGRGWSDIGYHVVVERVGSYYEAIVARPLFREGAHCPGKNGTHIGVCFAGNFQEEPPPIEQLLSGAKAIAGLVAALNLDPSMIEPHRDYRDTDCPGKAFPMDELKTMVWALLRYVPPAPKQIA